MSAHKKRKNSVIKDIYYTMFLLCRHLTYYEGETEVRIASLLVSIVGWCLFFSLYALVNLLFSWVPFGRWLAVSFVPMFVINYYLFEKKNRGDKFFDAFAEYSESKQTALYIAAAAIMTAILIGAGFTVITYRHSHGFS